MKEIKTCPVCLDEKPINEFIATKKCCKPCHNERNKKWKEANRESFALSQRIHNHKRSGRDSSTLEIVQQKLRKPRAKKIKMRQEQVENKTKLILGHFAKHSCIDCGEDRPLRLTFDHVRGEKKACIGDTRIAWSEEQLLQEIEKCEVRCFNCHMEKTAIERRFTKARLLGLSA